MTTLEGLLGIDPNDPAVLRATALAEQDYLLRRELIDMRKARGLSQEAVGRAMGITQATVAAFESLDNDPKLSTIRRYAIAVGALVAHSVSADIGQLGEGSRIEARTILIPSARISLRENLGVAPKLAITNAKRTDFAMAA